VYKRAIPKNRDLFFSQFNGDEDANELAASAAGSAVDTRAAGGSRAAMPVAMRMDDRASETDDEGKNAHCSKQCACSQNSLSSLSSSSSSPPTSSTITSGASLSNDTQSNTAASPSFSALYAEAPNAASLSASTSLSQCTSHGACSCKTRKKKENDSAHKALPVAVALPTNGSEASASGQAPRVALIPSAIDLYNAKQIYMVFSVLATLVNFVGLSRYHYLRQIFLFFPSLSSYTWLVSTSTTLFVSKGFFLF